MTITAPKIETLLGVLTIKLNDDNFVKWNYQLESVLQGYDLYGHFDGTSVCPSKYVITESEGVTTALTEDYRHWIQVDKSLLSLLIATLSDEAIKYVIGCKTARDAWLSLTDRYASVSRARVNQLKTELHTIHKGGDSSPLDASIPVISNKDAANNKALSLPPAAQGNSRTHALLGQQVKTKLWHLRLGHVSNEVLHHMLKISKIPLSVDSTTEMCDSCLQGKMHKLPFSSSSTTSLRPFAKLHTDVWGPSSVVALGVSTQNQSSPSLSTSQSTPVAVVMASMPQTPLSHSPVLTSSTSSANSSSSRSQVHDDQMLPVFTDAQLEVLLPLESTSSQMDNSATLPVQVLPASSINNHPMQTRSKSGIVHPKQFPEFSSFHTQLTSISEPDTPSHFKQALGHPAWQQAMTEEIQALDQQGTWTLVPPPPNTNVMGCKWIFKIKKNADGTISRYKARLVAEGFSQEYGLDYEETFSPVVRHTTVRLILGLAVNFQWELRQLDVKNAFLHGELQEEVFMKQPQGFIDSQYPDYVCKLQKSLYDLKQAPHAWNAKFTGYLPTLGFSVSHSDPSLFVKKTESAVVILLLYVDDIIITGSDPPLVTSVIQALSEVFELKDLGKLRYFLGLEVQYHSGGTIFVNQAKYARDLIKKASMVTCKPCSTPSKPHHQVLKDEGIPLPDPTLYGSIVGTLQYLTFTRPDIAFAVNTVCQFMHSPTDVHLGLVKRIIRYLQGTLQFGVNFSPGSMVLSGYCDADWAGDPNTRRSTTGYVVFLGSNPISWSSKKQASVSRSSTEAEYRALAHCAADISWIRQVLCDLQMIVPEAPILHSDNLSALALSANPIFHSRIKHLDVDFHFIRERVQSKDLIVQYVP
ncbi:unnamed protein product, partial [Prunus brigantina]